jgi:hypothetical protein
MNTPSTCTKSPLTATGKARRSTLPGCPNQRKTHGYRRSLNDTADKLAQAADDYDTPAANRPRCIRQRPN